TTSPTAISPRAGVISDIEFDPNQPQTVYVTYSTFKISANDGHIYKSTDAGQTWTAIDGSGGGALPDVPVNTIVIDPDDSSRLYIGTDIGIFASFDGGITWLPDSNPIANVIVDHLTLDRAGDTKYLYAFTYGRAVWRVALAGGSGPCSYSVSPLHI